MGTGKNQRKTADKIPERHVQPSLDLRQNESQKAPADPAGLRLRLFCEGLMDVFCTF